VQQIQGGNSFFVALDIDGVLYVWGECMYLGVAELKDKEENVVRDIINPI
jgi:alpha-tubulin suppressor-like RCC1 family protein